VSAYFLIYMSNRLKIIILILDMLTLIFLYCSSIDAIETPNSEEG